MTKEELSTFNTNDWNACIALLKKYWNEDYGMFNIEFNLEAAGEQQILELTTGGWSDNEEIINQLVDTWFWFLWWQESKRGGYYKFIYTEKITYESVDDKNLKPILEVLSLAKPQIDKNEEITAILDLEDLKSLDYLYKLYKNKN